MTAEDRPSDAPADVPRAFFETVVETVGVGVCVYGADGRFEYVNEAYAKLLDADRDSLRGTAVWEINPRFDRERFEGYWASFGVGETRTAETVHAVDGREVPVETVTTCRDIEGTVYHFGTVQDITEQRDYEARLRLLNETGRDLLADGSTTDIADRIVDVAGRLLELPFTVLYAVDDTRDVLTPTATTDATLELTDGWSGVEDLPTVSVDTAEMAVFRGGETTMIEDYQEADDPADPESPLGTLLLVPIGEYGLLAVGSRTIKPIAPPDRQLVDILGRHAVAAFDRFEQQRALAEREQRLQTIVENAPLILFTVNEDREITLQVGQGLEALGAEQNEMVGAHVEALFGDNSEILDAIERGFAGDAVDVTTDLWDRTYQVWYQPIEADGAVTGVIGVAMDITERTEHEHQIAALHDATREMVQANDVDEIATIAVRTAKETLGIPIAGLWLADEGGDQLEPVAATATAEDMFGEHPVYTEGNSLSWRAFATGESFLFDDLREEPGLYNPETAVRSELIIPLGAYGVLNLAATEPDVFTDNDVALANLLAANTHVALVRADRERELERQTDRMEFFNSILRHDVLNAVTVIKSRAEFLTEDLDGQPLGDAETIVEWSDDVKEIVHQVRTVLETLTGTGDPQLHTVDVAALLRAELDRVRTTYPRVTFEPSIPEEVSVLANDLLGDVLGNILTNAIDHNENDGLAVSITLERGADSLEIRVADNGQGVADDRKEAIFRRDVTGHAKSTGSGFGLYFVDVMVSEYAGEVWVEDNEAGGATFVVRLPAGD